MTEAPQRPAPAAQHRPSHVPGQRASTPRTRTIIIPPQDRPWMTRLRATTYVLTSVASLLFIALVVYGAVQIGRVGAALEQLSTTTAPTAVTEQTQDPLVGPSIP